MNSTGMSYFLKLKKLNALPNIGCNFIFLHIFHEIRQLKKTECPNTLINGD
jgi:hypothetical protein